MKKLSLFFLSLISCICAFADDDIYLADYHAKIDSLFEHIDCSTVETGILIDRGFCPISPKAFNGSECDSVSSDKKILKILYSELADSKVNNYCQMGAVDAIHSEIDSTKNISILYYAYNNFYEPSIKSGKIYIEDQQLRIDESKYGLVFDYNYCFAIALGVTDFSDKAISIPIKIGKLISNLSPRIATMEIKADNGLFEKVAINTTWNHTFSTYGEHALYFRIMFNDGNIMTCRTTIFVSESSGRQTVAPMDKAVESFLKIDADNQQAGGEIQVMYLDKEKTGGKFIRPLVIAGDIDFSKILTNANYTFDLATLDRKSDIGHKINELSKIFDIIYIKYNNDTDELLRNGILFRRAIEAINANRFTFCDKTYVVGIGTGGVIARIGINMMEKDSIDHNICKFIAVNSPFRGINIPLSMQSLMQHVSKFPSILKALVSDEIELANRFNDYLKGQALCSLVIQRIDGAKSCTNLLNSNWLIANTEFFVKPKNCQSVAIASADASVSPTNDFFSISRSVYFAEMGFNIELNGYSANTDNLIYDGKVVLYTNLLTFPVWKKNKYKVSGNSSVLPIDYSKGAKVSVKQFEGHHSIVKVSFPMSKFTITPCYSALDMTMSEFNSLTIFTDVKSSKFDRCHIVTSECTYPNVSPLLSALAEELTPRIEGNTFNILGTTELTLENVPNLSIIKYNWETANNNFKVISSSKNKAIITPTKYSTIGQSISDVITVSPKPIISFDSDILSSLKLSTNISAAHISIKGSDYISPELNVYELSSIPQDVNTVEWSASDGITLTPYEDNTVGAEIKSAIDNNWISCSFKSYGVDHEIRKSLKVATLDSAKMTILKHWYDPNEQIDKYYVHIDVFPANEAEEMYYCWSNTVSVSKKSSRFGIGISGVAKIRTEGDVGTCKKLGPVTLKPGTTLKPMVVNDATINGLDESVLEPAIMGKFEAIVSMPKITTSEVAFGKIKCDVSDYFGHSVSLYKDIESKWASAYSVAPNPADNILSISKTDDGISVCDIARSATVRLYDGNSLIREWLLTGDNKFVSISDIPSGTYFLNIEENGSIVYKQTIIIKH